MSEKKQKQNKHYNLSIQVRDQLIKHLVIELLQNDIKIPSDLSDIIIALYQIDIDELTKKIKEGQNEQ